MIISPYRTQFTHEHQDGDKNPSRDMTNRVALEAPARKAAALRKKEQE